ncbi:hypothetical protein HFN63_37000 [Rhizobium leguminosarum]|nr:hypothetical protein [Rhizobium leguminosarum]
MSQLRRYGISRVSELTALDRIGIPVFSAVRPLAATVTVSAGKGFDRDTAWVSAVMEAIDAQLAEQFNPEETLTAAANELDLPYDLMDLNPHPSSIFDRGTLLGWTKALDIVEMKSTYVPLDAVGLRGWFED